MKKKDKIIKDTAERWLLTYADLMNLLLIFFIILYSISMTDQQKFQELSVALSKAFGVHSGSTLINNGESGPAIIDNKSPLPVPTSGAKTEDQQFDEVQSQITDLIQQKNLQGDVEVSMQERGIVVSITAGLLFKSGSAALEPDARITIESIGKILLAIPGKQIRIEGHTDDDPIKNSTFPSNWELSSARATNVLRLLVDKVSIDPHTISSVGYGEYRPKLPNTSPQNKAANRRVDIVIVKDKFDGAEAGNNK